MVDGTSRRVAAGRTLINGTGYDVPFVRELKTQTIEFGDGFVINHTSSPNVDETVQTTSSYLASLTPEDLGIKSFDQIETAEITIQYVSGGLNKYNRRRYSTAEITGWANLAPNGVLNQVCWSDEERTTNYNSSYEYKLQGSDTLNAYWSGSVSVYRPYNYAHFYSITFTYWE